MSDTIQNESEIPAARFYVLANDRFLSDWGPAKGKVNTVILPCADEREVDAVRWYIAGRDEMKRVRVLHRKPRLRAGVLYSLMTRETSPVWFGIARTKAPAGTCRFCKRDCPIPDTMCGECRESRD